MKLEGMESFMFYVEKEENTVKKKKAKSQFSAFEFAMTLVKGRTFSKPSSVHK